MEKNPFSPGNIAGSEGDVMSPASTPSTPPRAVGYANSSIMTLLRIYLRIVAHKASSTQLSASHYNSM